LLQQQPDNINAQLHYAHALERIHQASQATKEYEYILAKHSKNLSPSFIEKIKKHLIHLTFQKATS
jgi:hypothetical protein